MLSQVSEWSYEHGIPENSALSIHEHMKSLFQPAIGSYPCDVILGGKVVNVDVSIHKSTTKNTISEMAEYTEKVVAYWVEQGVQFTDNRYE